MKIRFMGTREECKKVSEYFLEREDQFKSLMVSTLYPNRNSNSVFRLYVEVEYVGKIENMGACNG